MSRWSKNNEFDERLTVQDVEDRVHVIASTPLGPDEAVLVFSLTPKEARDMAEFLQLYAHASELEHRIVASDAGTPTRVPSMPYEDDALMGELFAAIKEVQRGGEHDGPCDNEDEHVAVRGPCERHIQTTGARRERLRRALDQLDKGDRCP